MYEVFQGATFPPITATLRNPDGTPYNLTAHGVNFAMSKWRDFEAVVTGVAQVTETPADGKATYQWDPGDLDEPGYYMAHFWVILPDDRAGGFAPEEYIAVRVKPRIQQTAYVAAVP